MSRSVLPPFHRLLVHLPCTKNSLRKISLPVFDSQNVHLLSNSSQEGRLDSYGTCNVKTQSWTSANRLWNEIEILAQIQMEKSKDQIHLVDFLGISSLPIEGKQSIVSLTEPLQPCLDKSMTVLTQISKAMFDLHSQHEIIHRNLTFKSIAQSLRDPSVVKVVNFEYACKLKEDQFLLVLPKDDLDEGFLFAGRRSKSQISEEEEKVESQKSQNRQYNKHVAPELIANQENRTYNRKIDVFAFGQLMFDFLHEKSKLEWTHEDKMLRRLYERCVCANPEDRPEFEEIHTSLQREFPFAVEPRTSFSTFTKDQMSLSPTIGTSASIGHIRRTMEDSLCVMESADRSSIALAVFDGLRQGRTSEFAAKRFPFLTFSTFSSKKQMEDNLISSLAEIDRELTEITPTIECGSTATCALVNQKELALAWLGDSSAFLVRKKRAPESSSSSEDISKSSNSNFHAISLITKHAPDREDELVRIDKSQGSVGREMMQLETGETVPIGPWRVFATESASPNIGIAISRSLGLFPFRPSISNQPEVVKLERKPKEDYFLVIASDGLWDLLDIGQVLRAMIDNKSDPQKACDQLVKQVLDRGAHDNVSVIIVRLDE